MSSFRHAIILDFEATCDDRRRPQPQEIIEFPSVLLSLESREIVDEFTSFVRPHHHPVLTAFCRELTSIGQSDVDRAEGFPEVFARHRAWLDRHRLSEGDAVFVTCGDWDLGTMLPAQCVSAAPPVEALPPIYTRWQNVKRAFCAVTGRPKAPGMAGMMRSLDLEVVGHHHRGIDDCRNIAALLRALLEQGAVAEVTSELPISKYPPITIRLRLGERVEEVRLRSRNVKALERLAGRVFRRQLGEIRRQGGGVIAEDGDLLALVPGEELRLD